ncbi:MULTISPECIES: hypothetical protein [Cyanophyceae]|uniref:hypothetical protein n=1 Tax=Cyanophyceae TaxID=3028117 RepID=UPI00016DC843|nr:MULTISPECIES: hypothetical protein [Cyanophyceae]ACA98833.1 hypothetical protein SYNPCC7002_A0829 [Picosynechococcus sp. PCC 7002]SMH38222.1 hypothetical protein SAMN06272755_0896 [Picosynechococcus sp. OG1]SMQ77965.1 hypothetical protein SAMN06272774_0175 [Synechococcus sp. 7002]
MSIDKNLFSKCVKFDDRRRKYCLDFSSLINKLILFDKVILDSPNFYEVNGLVEELGFEQTLSLLSSGILKFSCDLRITSQVAQNQHIISSKKTYPQGFYQIQYAFAAEQKIWISDNLKNIRHSELSKSKVKKLKLTVVESLDKNYLKDNIDLLKQTDEDLQFNRGVKVATLNVLKKEYSMELDSEIFDIKLHQVDKSIFKVETNLSDLCSLNETEIYKIVEKAVLGIGNFNLRMAEMNMHNALSCFMRDEIDLLKNRLEYIFFKKDDPNKLEANFDSILNLKRHPKIIAESNPKIDINKLMKVRQSDELKLFRNWLKDIEEVKEKEILQELNSIRAKLGVNLNTNTGKFLRLGMSTLAGLIPNIGMQASIPLSVLDNFLLDKVLPASPIVTFVDDLYPSIFKQH